MEKRAQFVEQEMLFQNKDTPGILFKNSGGFWGDMAKVYMLHGTPDYMEILQNGRTFVDLMVWIYLDESGQRHKYRFLFYHKNGGASFMLFRPVFDMELGLQEINRNRQFIATTEVYDEIAQRFGYVFLQALVYFSDDSSLNVDKALDPPKTAAEIIKNEAPTIQGELPQKNEEIIYKNNFGSTIPAELSYELTNDTLVVKLVVRHENLDWILKNNELVAELDIKIIVWSEEGEYSKQEISQNLDIVSTKEKIEEKKSAFVFESLPIKFSKQSRITVYIKNNNKYNAWVEEIKK